MQILSDADKRKLIVSNMDKMISSLNSKLQRVKDNNPCHLYDQVILQTEGMIAQLQELKKIYQI